MKQWSDKYKKEYNAGMISSVVCLIVNIVSFVVILMAIIKHCPKVVMDDPKTAEDESIDPETKCDGTGTAMIITIIVVFLLTIIVIICLIIVCKWKKPSHFMDNKARDGLRFNISNESIEKIVFDVDYGYDGSTVTKEPVINIQNTQFVCSFASIVAFHRDCIERGSGMENLYFVRIEYRPENETETRYYRCDDLEGPEARNFKINIEGIINEIDSEWKDRIKIFQ